MQQQFDYGPLLPLLLHLLLLPLLRLSLGLMHHIIFKLDEQAQYMSDDPEMSEPEPQCYDYVHHQHFHMPKVDRYASKRVKNPKNAGRHYDGNRICQHSECTFQG